MAGNRRRRSFSISVRTLLGLVLAVSAWLGVWVNRSREQRDAVRAIRAFDDVANLTYDNEVDAPLSQYGGMGGGFRGVVEERRSWWQPKFIEDRLGRDFFHTVDSAAFGQGTPAPGTVRDLDITREVARLRGLRQVTLYIPVDGDDLERLSDLRSLAILHLGEASPGLTDASLRTLGRMRRLESLGIFDAPITDAGLSHLASLSRLESLDLGYFSNTVPGGTMFRITGEGFSKLAGLPRLTRLDLRSERLTDEGLEHLGALRNLRHLRLKGGSFSDEGLRSLAALTDLESLEFQESAIDGTGFRHLAGLSKLEYVCLEGPNVTDEAVPHLARLPALKSVMIYGTGVTASGLEGFRAAPRRTQMGLWPAVSGDTKRLKRALPNCSILNGGKAL